MYKIIILILIVLLTQGCSKKEKNYTNINEISEKQKKSLVKIFDKVKSLKIEALPKLDLYNKDILLRYQFNKKNKNKVILNMSIKTKYQKMNSDIIYKMYADLNTINTVNDIASIEITFTRLIINMKNNETIIIYDSNSKFDERIKIPGVMEMEKMLYFPINIKVDKLGQISEVDLTNVLNKFDKSNGALEIKAQFISNAETIINSIFIKLPKEKIKIGDKFSEIKEQSYGNIKLLKNINYKIHDISKDGRLVLLVLDTKINLKNIDSDIKLESNNSSGWILFDAKKHEINKSSIYNNININMNSIIMNNQILNNYTKLNDNN